MFSTISIIQSYSTCLFNNLHKYNACFTDYEVIKYYFNTGVSYMKKAEEILRNSFFFRVTWTQREQQINLCSCKYNFLSCIVVRIVWHIKLFTGRYWKGRNRIKIINKFKMFERTVSIIYCAATSSKRFKNKVIAKLWPKHGAVFDTTLVPPVLKKQQIINNIRLK